MDKRSGIADVAQLKRHQGCGCACAVPAPVVTARAHLQLALRRWWRLGCATSAIEGGVKKMRVGGNWHHYVLNKVCWEQDAYEGRSCV